MNLDNLSKLMSLVGRGFVVNDIISLLNKDNYNLNDKDCLIMKQALKYIDYIKKGHKFINYNKIPHDLEESLEFYNMALNILVNKILASTIEEFNELIDLYKKQLNGVLESNIIKTTEVEEVKCFFEYMREHLLEECRKYR